MYPIYLYDAVILLINQEIQLKFREESFSAM